MSNKKTQDVIRERLIEYRLKSGLSVKEVALKAESTEKTIFRLESSGYKFMPTLTTLIKLCYVYDVKLETLFKGL